MASLFDEYAERFDQDLTESLNYRGPELVLDAIARTGGGQGLAVLDLGCGTGLCAPGLRPLAARLDGVDLSPRMVEKAAERGLYDRLEVGELAMVLAARPGGYDLLAAADVFVYLGDLEPVLAAAHDALTPGGRLVFTTERVAGEGYDLGPHARYGHSRSYLVARAAAAGFVLELLEETATRWESGLPVPSWLAVMRRG